jgi:hypothetical protein
VVCGNCQTVLCQPTGGKARLQEGCSFRKKWDWDLTNHSSVRRCFALVVLISMTFFCLWEDFECMIKLLAE